ncbi:MAG: hypothetical protein KC561_05425 [Myxococcales bacterium]|nr:hypothetical protein [Myxococcales bacterium]
MTQNPRNHSIASPLLLALFFLIGLLGACDHGSEKTQLLGTWEGTIPSPSTGDPIPVGYILDDQSATIVLGFPDNQVVSEWSEWEVSRVIEGDLVLHFQRNDGTVFATMARIEGDTLRFWDQGTEDSTAAVVTRVEALSLSGTGHGASQAEPDSDSNP